MSTLTITTTNPQDARIVIAFGRYLGFPPGVDATGPQVKQAVIDFIVNVVREYERKVAADAASAAVAPIAPT